MFEKVFGQSVEETLRETREEGVAARARKAEAVPSRKEVEERNLDRALLRSWCLRYMKGRAEAYGHKKIRGNVGDAPTVSLDYTHMPSEQEKEEEKGMPIIVVKNDKTKLVMAKVVPNKGVQEYAVEVVRKFVEQSGYSKVYMMSDNERAILATMEAVRRETSVEIVMEKSLVGYHQAKGVVENAVMIAQGQFRVLKDALESRINRRVEGDHRAVP